MAHHARTKVVPYSVGLPTRPDPGGAAQAKTEKHVLGEVRDIVVRHARTKVVPYSAKTEKHVLGEVRDIVVRHARTKVRRLGAKERKL